ncbi:MAG: helix-turn-helix domain-containing protein [Prevotella sp.]|nr:helix-turn-helix domain-containing protein [Prevotella sp.]
MGRTIHTFILAAALTAAGLLLGTVSALGQTLQASVKHYSTDDGLGSNAISKIRQDDYGFLWLATWNGLTRFDGYEFYNYETGAISGIPHLHNRIVTLAIDKAQNVWMNMYDQRVFVMKRCEDRIINPFEGITANETFRINLPVTVVSNGDVLAAVEGIGIYKLRLEESGGVEAQLVTTGDLKVTGMAEGYQNDVWLATNQGVHRMDADNLSVERKGYFLDEEITAIFSNGFNVYAGTQSGKILSFAYGQEPQQLKASGEPVNGIFVDSHGLIWYADSRFGAGYLNPETMQERFFSQEVKFPDYDGYGGEFGETEGTVWVRMNHGGFGYYDRETDQVRYFYNSPENSWNLSNTVNAFLSLNDGVVWESTSRHGLEKLEIMKDIIERRRVVDTETSTLDNEIRAMFYDKKHRTLLIGNKKGALFAYADDGTRREFTSDSQGNPLGRVYGISGDSQGNVWLSSKDYGLFKMSSADGHYTIKNYQHDPDNPHSLSSNRAYLSQEDQQGNIWVATYGGGVNLMPKGSERFIHPDDMIDYPHGAYRKVRTISIDREGTIWAGTTDGILLLRYEKGQVTASKLEPSYEKPDMILRSNDIVCMTRDSLGSIWMGTNSGGLAHEVGKDSQGHYLFECFGIQEGLPSDEVRSITFGPNGNVWFATDYIICSYNPERHIISTYSSLEGVDETLCSEASAITMPDGTILFGTLNGYYHIDLTRLMAATGSMLKVHLTDFWVDGVLQSPRFTTDFDYYVPNARRVELKSRPTEISFRFASLDYHLQHRVHYQYRLEGYEDEWHNADRRRIATYRNLPGGTYRLVVQAFLQESPDKKDQLALEVVIPASFFNSSFAIWVYILLAMILCIFLLFRAQDRIKHRIAKNGDSLHQGAEDGHNEFDVDEMLKHRNSEDPFMQQLNTWLEAHYSDPAASEDEMMECTWMSRVGFTDELKRVSGKSPRQFLTAFRISKARQLLEETSKSLDDIASETGFENTDQFDFAFRTKLRMSPEEYREKKQDLSTDEYEIIS